MNKGCTNSLFNFASHASSLSEEMRLLTKQQTNLMSFDDVFQFPEQLWLDVRAQVDDGSCQAVVLK